MQTQHGTDLVMLRVNAEEGPVRNTVKESYMYKSGKK